MRPVCHIFTPYQIPPCRAIRQLLASSALQGCQRQGCTADATARNKSLGHIDPAYRNDVAGIIDKAEASLDLWTPSFTDFFPPPVVADALAVLKGVLGS